MTDVTVRPHDLSTVSDRIAALATVVTADATAADQLRTLPVTSVRELRSLRLFGLQAPREVGGEELDPIEAMIAFEALTALDTSIGWCTAIASTGAAVVGARLSPAAVDVVFEAGVPAFAGSFAPTGVANAAPGGYRVKGRWSFASGIHHADWVTGGCITQDGQVITIVVPKSVVTVIDNWYVAGLQGTGSCDWIVEDLFVPADFTIAADAPPIRGGASFTLPLFSYIAAGHTGFALGCARRALADLMEAADQKVRLLSSTSVASRSAFQRDFGQTDTALRAARTLALDRLGAAWTSAQQAETITLALQLEIRAAATYATDVASHACTLAFRSLGAHALHTGNAVQRYFRDIHAAAQHAYVADTTYDDLAKLRFGL